MSETFGYLAEGFSMALTPAALLAALAGVTLGTLIGVLPGIGPAMTVALLLPITYSVDPVTTFVLFAGIYYGAMFGGSTTSILLNTPGEAASVMTAQEGHKMALAGRAAPALATAAIGSWVAGTLGTIGLTLAARPLVEWALTFTAVDYLALTVLAFTAVATMLGSSRVRGFAALALGITLGVVGTVDRDGQTRLTGGLELLEGGIDTITLAIGLFAVGEVLYAVLRKGPAPAPVSAAGSKWLSRNDFRRSWRPWLRGTLIGFPFGVIPAGGADTPTFVSYAVERRLARRPSRVDEFGKGAIEGVAGPEAANNAAAAGVLVPLLALGLPTSATAAVLLAAFQSYGIRPGPLLMDNQPTLVWTLIASLYIGNVMLLVLNLPLVRIWAQVLRIPRPYLYVGILLCAGLSTYATNGSLLLLAVLGVLGYLLRRFDWPIGPVVLGQVLGPATEEYLLDALQIHQGNATALLSTGFARTMYAIVLALMLLPLALRLWRRMRPRPEDLTSAR